jgi:sulfur carrier protein
MKEKLTLNLNGSQREFETAAGALGEPPNVSGLVQVLGFRADRVALELNGDIVPRSQWTATNLSDGDRVELVHFVGGGQ